MTTKIEKEKIPFLTLLPAAIDQSKNGRLIWTMRFA
jgi:hypothetical protein